MVAGERPGAEVDPQLLETPAGAVVGDERVRKVDSSALAVEVEYHLLEAALLRDDALDVFERGVTSREPFVRLAHEVPERPHPFDAPAQRMVQLRLAGEGLDQGIDLPDQQPVEVGHVHDLSLLLLFQLLERRRGEQLG